MRIGLVGAGRIGSLHAETLSRLPEVTSVVLADVDPARARTLAEKLGVQAAETVDEIFRTDVDGVVIAAATAGHAELVCAAADAGLPVFCEKPIAPDVAGTRAVLERVGRRGVPLHVGFQRRFDPGYRAVRDALREGRLGWLHTLRACTCDPTPPPASYLPTSGGLFRDCAVHDFDAIRWVTGREVRRVYATGANRGDDFFAACGDVDTAAAILEMDDGTLASVTATRYNGAGYDARLEACGSRGTLVAGLDGRAPLPSGDPRTGGVRGEQPPYRGFADRFRDAYVAELTAFVDMAAGRIASPCPGEDALEALLIAEAAELSRTRDRPVELAEVR